MTTVKASFADIHPVKLFLLKVIGILVHGVLSGAFAHLLIGRFIAVQDPEQLFVLPFAVALGAMFAWIKPVTTFVTTMLAAAAVLACFAIYEPTRLSLASSVTFLFAPFALPFLLEKLYRLFR